MYEENELIPEELVDQTSEELLESLSLDMIKANMISQIRGEVAPTRDFLGIVISKIHTILNSVTDPVILKDIRLDTMEFSRELLIAISHQFHFTIVPATDDSDEEYMTMLDVLYNFFIIQREEYVRVFLLNYINIHKDAIVEQLGIGGKKNDVTTLAYKKREMDRDDVAIIANITEVVDYVQKAPIGPVEFLEVADDGGYQIDKITEYYQSSILVGNFVPTFLDSVLDETCSESALRVRNDIRYNLYMSVNGEL